MTDASAPALAARPRVGLYVTCLVDLMRPSVGLAAAKLIEEAGCTVEAPREQTCCGQPAYNSGEPVIARRLARQVVDAFEPFDYVVAPSGSCAGMLKTHYPKLLADAPAWSERAAAFSGKVHELVSFLADVRGVTRVAARFEGVATYHDSCSGLRELGVRSQPRKLLATVEGLTLKDMAEAEACCGFGGSFAVKYPDISNAILEKKTANIAATGADLLIAGDLGCLFNMAGKLKRQGQRIAVRHVAEVLAGMRELPAIGERR